ncbi:putative synaptosomal-associated protein [Planoprotostelium fungivorum]|uniref:Synaptosomal-associated protein 47 n=1 Tax=Planoprotostelium fungivorum TaxID=1890364 RepID=A0A2P6N4Q6_9EUKA|nr:putative synaptosomal-associated protein [Planoprotostelium fungivorum]
MTVTEKSTRDLTSFIVSKMGDFKDPKKPRQRSGSVGGEEQGFYPLRWWVQIPGHAPQDLRYIISKIINDKERKLKSSNQKMKDTFNIMSSESVIQAHIYVTQNYLGYIPDVIGSEKLIPLMQVRSVEHKQGLMGVGASVNVTLEDGTLYAFRTLLNKNLEEIANLLNYLIKHPPMWIQVDDDDDLPVSSPSSAHSSVRDDDPGLFPSRLRDSGREKPLEISGTKQYATVDTKASKEALRKAQEAKELGILSLNSLHQQGEQLDRVERNLDKIDANMDAAEKITKGMNRMGGLFNTAPDKKATAGGSAITSALPKRKIDLDLDTKVTDMDVLQKLKNCNLVPVILRFSNDRFMFLNPKDKKPITDTIKSYEQINTILIRTRPQHIDIKFKDGRLRVVSAYMQQLVGEFVQRSTTSIPIVFESGSRKFKYGINMEPTTKQASFNRAVIEGGKTEGSSSSFVRTNGAIEGSSGSSFKRTAPASNPSNRVFQDAPDHVKLALQEQDQDLDEMEKMLDDLGIIASSIGGELDRQNEQLDKIDTKVEHANIKTKNMNKTLTKML